MNEREFKEFIKGKTTYHHNVYWIEKWKGNESITKYFPHNGFLLSNKYKLKQYPHPGYGPNCLDNMTTMGKNIYQLPTWKVTIKRTPKQNLYYVSKGPSW